MAFRKLPGRSMLFALGMAAVCAAPAGAQSAQVSGDAGAAQPAATLTPDVDAGAELYATECRGCHAVSIAPTLRGVLDRPIASVAAFTGYSAGLKARSGQTWTHANLDAFLTAPAAFAPGTLMTKTIPDPQMRADIIAYIETLPPPR